VAAGWRRQGRQSCGVCGARSVPSRSAAASATCTALQCQLWPRPPRWPAVERCWGAQAWPHGPRTRSERAYSNSVPRRCRCQAAGIWRGGRLRDSRGWLLIWTGYDALYYIILTVCAASGQQHLCMLPDTLELSSRLSGKGGKATVCQHRGQCFSVSQHARSCVQGKHTGHQTPLLRARRCKRMNQHVLSRSLACRRAPCIPQPSHGMGLQRQSKRRMRGRLS
jgi:hypothetical protein